MWYKNFDNMGSTTAWVRIPNAAWLSLIKPL